MMRSCLKSRFQHKHHVSLFSVSVYKEANMIIFLCSMGGNLSWSISEGRKLLFQSYLQVLIHVAVYASIQARQIALYIVENS